MLISRLVFDCRTDKNTQICNLATENSQMLSNLTFTSPMGWTSVWQTEWAAVYRKYLSNLLYFGKIKPINIQLIKQQVRMTYCQLLFVKRYYRGSPQPSEWWHLTTAIAVKSNVDPKERFQLRMYKVTENNISLNENRINSC